MQCRIWTQLWSHLQSVHHRRAQEGPPLVCVPQVHGFVPAHAHVAAPAHVHAHSHVLGRALCDVVPRAQALAPTRMDMVRMRCLGRRRSSEAQSGALGRS